MASIVLFESVIDLLPDIKYFTRDSKHVVVSVSSVDELQRCVKQDQLSLVIINITNDVSVVDVYNEANLSFPGGRFVVVVANPDASELEHVIRSGALDYIRREDALEKIADIVSRFDSFVPNDSAPTQDVERRFGIVGNNKQMKDCIQLVSRSSQSDASVLIHGETGTGKELIARAIHGLSRRKDKNLVVVDCASLHASLVESILFGHAKGAFTGAGSKSLGLIARANGGTLFLDEVSELPLDLQKKFLRVLQERRFLPVGEGHEVNSDFRLVAATNKDLRKMVKDGMFRADLLYRIQSVKIELPPLRQRLDDLPSLVTHLVKKSCLRNNFPTKTFSRDFSEILAKHDWPGNVRELENVIDSVVAFSLGQDHLFPELLPPYIRVKSAMRSVATRDVPSVRNNYALQDSLDLGASGVFPTYKHFRNQMLDTIDRRYFLELFRVSEGKVVDAMRLANLSRARIYDFYKKHGITKGVQ